MKINASWLALFLFPCTVTAQDSPAFPNFASSAPEFVAASMPIDVNRDGVIDLVGVGVDDQDRPVAQVALFGSPTGQGAANISQTHVLNVSGEVGRARCADVNGDRLQDLIAIVYKTTPELHVSRGAVGSALFSVLLNVPIGVGGPIEVAELDGDGLLDVLVGSTQGLRFPFFSRPLRVRAPLRQGGDA